MPRYAAKITEQELVDKILEAYNNHEDFSEYGNAAPITDPKDMNRPFLKWLTPEIDKDFAKIDFDSENICGAGDYFSSPTPNLMKVHTTSTGVTFFGLMMGGDWEFPIYCIIYWDGKKLRGYVPTDGQCYDEECKAAYGSGESEEPEDPAHDPEKLLADIEHRIEIKGGPKSSKPKPATKQSKSRISYKMFSEDKTAPIWTEGYSEFITTFQTAIYRCKGSVHEDVVAYSNNLAKITPDLAKYLNDPSKNIYEIISGLEDVLHCTLEDMSFGVAMVMNELYGGDPHSRNPTAVMPERYAHILASDYIAKKLIKIGNIDEDFVFEARKKFPLAPES